MLHNSILNLQAGCGVHTFVGLLVWVSTTNHQNIESSLLLFMHVMLMWMDWRTWMSLDDFFHVFLFFFSISSFDCKLACHRMIFSLSIILNNNSG